MTKKHTLIVSAVLITILFIGISCAKKYPIENFFAYIENENIEAIQELLQDGQFVNYSDNSGKTALMYAITATPENESRLKHYEILQLFFQYGANLNRVDQNGWPALFYAMMENDEKAFLLLLENGADIHKDIFGKTLLQHADELNKPAFVEILMLNE